MTKNNPFCKYICFKLKFYFFFYYTYYKNLNQYPSRYSKMDGIFNIQTLFDCFHLLKMLIFTIHLFDHNNQFDRNIYDYKNFYYQGSYKIDTKNFQVRHMFYKRDDMVDIHLNINNIPLCRCINFYKEFSFATYRKSNNHIQLILSTFSRISHITCILTNQIFGRIPIDMDNYHQVNSIYYIFQYQHIVYIRLIGCIDSNSNYCSREGKYCIFGDGENRLYLQDIRIFQKNFLQMYMDNQSTLDLIIDLLLDLQRIRCKYYLSNNIQVSIYNNF